MQHDQFAGQAGRTLEVSPTNPAHDYWLLVDPGETVDVHTVGAFLSFLVSPGCHGATLGTRSTREKYCVVTLKGPMDDAGRHARLTYRLTAEEVHALLSAEEKRMLIAALERMWSRPSVAGHPLAIAASALNLPLAVLRGGCPALQE